MRGGIGGEEEMVCETGTRMWERGEGRGGGKIILYLACDMFMFTNSLPHRHIVKVAREGDVQARVHSHASSERLILVLTLTRDHHAAGVVVVEQFDWVLVAVSAVTERFDQSGPVWEVLFIPRVSEG